MSSGGGSFGTASLHVGTDWTVRCCTYPETTPILSIDAGSTAVSVSIADRERITAEAVAFARELARQLRSSPPTASGCTPHSTTSPPRARPPRPDARRDGRELAPSGRPWSLPTWHRKEEVIIVCAAR